MVLAKLSGVKGEPVYLDIDEVVRPILNVNLDIASLREINALGDFAVGRNG